MYGIVRYPIHKQWGYTENNSFAYSFLTNKGQALRVLLERLTRVIVEKERESNEKGYLESESQEIQHSSCSSINVRVDDTSPQYDRSIKGNHIRETKYISASTRRVMVRRFSSAMDG